MILTCIRHLCFFSCPSAIRCPIILQTLLTFAASIPCIVVLPVYAIILCWSFAHISKECFKRITPSVADFYTSIFVAFGMIGFFVFDSINQTSPSPVFDGFRHSMCFLERITTATAFSVILYQTYRRHNFLVSALTNALPELIFVFVRTYNFFSNKTAKFSVGQIKSFTHAYI